MLIFRPTAAQAKTNKKIISSLTGVVLSSYTKIIQTCAKSLVLAVLSLGLVGVVIGQAKKPQPQTVKKGKLQPEYSLKVTTADIIGISLKAENAPLSKIASELSAKLKIPVLVASSVQQHPVTADFKDLTLEPALHFLAPQVYVDYEINSSPGGQARPLGIYLNAFDDPEPALGAIVPARNEAILIEGNTEDVAEPVQQEVPTKIRYERNSLSVSAKQQPLTVVLYMIADELKIPFEMKWDTSEVVDVNIDNLPLEEAMARLTPHVRLFVRANLQKFERKPFRMVLVRPAEPVRG